MLKFACVECWIDHFEQTCRKPGSEVLGWMCCPQCKQQEHQDNIGLHKNCFFSFVSNGVFDFDNPFNVVLSVSDERIFSNLPRPVIVPSKNLTFSMPSFKVHRNTRRRFPQTFPK